MAFASLSEVYSVEELRQLEIVRQTLLEDPEAFEVKEQGEE